MAHFIDCDSCGICLNKKCSCPTCSYILRKSRKQRRTSVINLGWKNRGISSDD